MLNRNDIRKLLGLKGLLRILRCGQTKAESMVYKVERQDGVAFVMPSGGNEIFKESEGLLEQL